MVMYKLVQERSGPLQGHYSRLAPPIHNAYIEYKAASMDVTYSICEDMGKYRDWDGQNTQDVALKKRCPLGHKVGVRSEPG